MSTELSQDANSRSPATQRRSRLLEYASLATAVAALLVSILTLLIVLYKGLSLDSTFFAKSVVIVEQSTDNSLVVLDQKLQRGVITVRDSNGVLQDVTLFKAP